jgi:RNA polymerase sigma-70 factor (ECF subfamily)
MLPEEMLRLAAGYVPNQAVAEEVVQDIWVGFLRGLSGFEGRLSMRTWLFRILVNRAVSAGNWSAPPAHWADLVDDQLAAKTMADRSGGPDAIPAHPVPTRRDRLPAGG